MSRYNFVDELRRYKAVIWSGVALAFIIAYGLTGLVMVRLLVIGSVLSVAFTLIIILAMRAIIGATKRSLAPIVEARRTVERMSIADARQEAFRLMSDGSLLKCFPCSSVPTQIGGMPEGVRDLFDKCSHISIPDQDIEIGISYLSISCIGKDFTRIGMWNGTCEVVMTLHEVEVYIVDQSDGDTIGDIIAGDDNKFPSVYHLIVYFARQVVV